MSTQKTEHRNEVRIHGILFRDPDLRQTRTGKAVCNFTVQTTHEKYNEFHSCVAWEATAEKLAARFRKGDFIRLAGRLQTRSWEQDGAKRYRTEIVVWNFNDGATETNLHGLEVSDDDLPDF
jgi:single-strand DNA-binding protein